MRVYVLVTCAALAAVSPVAAQSASPDQLEQQLRQIAQRQQGSDHDFAALRKAIDDVLWHLKVGDIANIDKVRFTSKPGRSSNPTGQGAGNPMIIPAYTFVPKKLTGTAPLIVFVHGGVHGSFDTGSAHITRELIYQDAPGGHAFNRIDTPLARESRKEIYAFLARHLKK